MALNTNPFVEGIDPSGTFGGYASVLLQLIRQAQPSSTYGMILFDTATPDVTGANAWRKRCIWVSLLNPNLPTVNIYKEGTSPGWTNVNDVISNGTIVTAMIANLAVTLAKLSPAGGTANQLIRVNGTATAFEFVSLSSLVTAGSIPVSALITTGIPAGQLRFAGVVGPGTATWYDAQQIINALSNAAIGTDLIAPAPVTSTRSKMLTTRTADTFATWRYFEPNVDILNDTMNGSKLQSGTVGPEKLYSTGVPDGYLLSKVGGVPDWIPQPTANYVTKYASTPTALPTTGNTITPLNHGLSGQPINVYGVLVCDSPEHNYIKYDEVPLDQIYTSSAGSEKPVFSFYATTTQIKCVRTNTGGLLLANATTGVQATLTDANWLIKFYAIK